MALAPWVPRPLPVPTAVTHDCDGYLPVVPSSFLNKLLTW